MITGGASGIGKATALALLAAGAKVYIADISRPAIQRLETECENANLSGIHSRCVDVSKLADVESWIDAVQADSQGRVDIFVHCAVKCDWSRIENQSIDNILQTMQVGFDGMVYCTKTILPFMRAQKFGRLIYLSSITSTLQLFPGYAAYAALKAATDAWANILRIELRGSGVEVACIRPGIVKGTDFFQRSVPRESLPRLLDLLPATTPEAIAKTILKAIQKPNRTYVVPRRYRLLEWSYRLTPQLLRQACRYGTSRRTDIQTKDDLPQ